MIEHDERIDKFENIWIKNKNTLPDIAVKRCSSGDIDETVHNAQRPPNFILEDD